MLMQNQQTFYLGHESVRETLKLAYLRYFDGFSSPEEEMLLHAGDPHIKKALREQAREEIIEAGTEHAIGRNWCPKTCTWKLKSFEDAKPGKYPRCIVDLTVPASLYGFRLFDCLKQAMSSESLFYKGGEIEFIKSPDPFSLESAFKKLLNPPGRFYFCYFSDDACLSIRVNGEVWFFNLDISSCDASHSDAQFRALLDITPDRLKKWMKQLMKQCKSNLCVRNPEKYKEYVKFKLLRYMLLSGWTGTTAINGLANVSIACAIADYDISNPGDIALAARVAGYVVTGGETPLPHPEQLQFLKHSPMLDKDGVYRPVLNFGVMLRCSGRTHGDLPGRGPIEPRAWAFQRGLLRGAYPRTSFEALRAMQAAAGTGEILHTGQFDHKVVDNPDYPSVDINTQSFCRRYNMSIEDHKEMCVLLRSSSYGTQVSSPVFSTILSLDYGLESAGITPLPYLQPGG